MPYFFASRKRPAPPFAASIMTACVLDAPDLATAEANYQAMLAKAVKAGREYADAYEIVALDDQSRSEQGAVAAAFTHLG